MLGRRKVRMRMRWIRVDFGVLFLFWTSWLFRAFFLDQVMNRDDTRLDMGWRM
jgi:hypothetical protein